MKVALVITDPDSAWHFRRNLISALIFHGQEVTVITPRGDRVSDIVALGARHVAIEIDRFFNPAADAKFMWRLFCIMRARKFDVVHNFSVKPNTLGAVAERLARVRHIIGSVTGLGYVFVGGVRNPAQWALKGLVYLLYWIGLRLSNRVWFQNNDDLQLLVCMRLVTREKAVLIRGSGVDTDFYHDSSVDRAARDQLRSEFNIQDENIVLTMVARPLGAKGVREFIDAARRAEAAIPHLRCLLVGGHEEGNPDNVPMSYIASHSPSCFTFLGWRNDVRGILAISDVVVLPSYREGLPKSLVEALSMGKPIIATDVPGCRDMIANGKNGVLVPPRDAAQLASAMIHMCRNKDRFAEMGAISRDLACSKFDEKVVLKQMMASLYSIDAAARSQTARSRRL
jgi:N,N'-diacetylbacillosaminyl-diphospho-undecaprenol alpha-1,3-N-acetylgalactosaminyltransferase